MLDRIHCLHLMRVLHRLWLLLLLELEDFLCIYLGIGSAYFYDLSTVIRRFEKLDIFHLLVVP